MSRMSTNVRVNRNESSSKRRKLEKVRGAKVAVIVLDVDHKLETCFH
jgi:hypothetical protein